MTHPSSPFPSLLQLIERDYNSRGQSQPPPRDFPILRSSPLWKQTWVALRGEEWQPAHLAANRCHLGHFGYWFPPLYCDRNGPPAEYTKIAHDEKWLERLYTVDNCPDCTAALQAVELMVHSIAWEFRQWPDGWEHRCWFREVDRGEPSCVCGAHFSLTDMSAWRGEMDHAVERWARRNQYINGDLRNTGEIRGYNWSWAAIDWEPDGEFDGSALAYKP